MKQIGITKNFITVIFFKIFFFSFLSNHSMVANSEIHFFFFVIKTIIFLSEFLNDLYTII